MGVGGEVEDSVPDLESGGGYGGCAVVGYAGGGGVGGGGETEGRVIWEFVEKGRWVKIEVQYLGVRGIFGGKTSCLVNRFTLCCEAIEFRLRSMISSNPVWGIVCLVRVRYSSGPSLSLEQSDKRENQASQHCQHGPPASLVFPPCFLPFALLHTRNQVVYATTPSS
jgi:hypothetical protein